MKSGGKTWLAMCAWPALCSLVASALHPTDWDWQPALAASEPWRWWSAAFVHWSAAHLAANLVALALVATLGAVATVPLVITLAWLASWPLLHLGLLVQPELAHYGGLSGLVHSGVAVVAVFVAVTEGGARRAIGVAMLVGLAIKITLEAPWAAAPPLSISADVPVAPMVHLSGAVTGLLCTLLALARGPLVHTEPELEPVASDSPSTAKAETS